MSRRSRLACARPGRTLIGIFIAGTLILGCSPAAAPSSSAVPSSSAGPSLIASAAGIVLQRTGPIGCDAIGIDYTSATIHIDAASEPDVWAETDKGKKVTVRWTDGFNADGSPPVIRGPEGQEVARDGTVVNVPAAGNLALAGYFVCFSPDALYVLETPPQ